MDWRKRAAQVLIYIVLEIGAMMGVPMRPSEIEEMTRRMNNAVVEETIKDEEPSGDPPSEDDETS